MTDEVPAESPKEEPKAVLKPDNKKEPLKE